METLILLTIFFSVFGLIYVVVKVIQNRLWGIDHPKDYSKSFIEHSFIKSNSKSTKPDLEPSKEEMAEYYANLYLENQLKIDKVTDLYAQNNKVAYYKEGSIVIDSDRKYPIEIDRDHIALNEDKLAWFEEEHYSNYYMLHIYEGEKKLEWEPISHNLSFGCDAYLLKWINKKLLFIYKEKHDIYICIFDNMELTEVHFHGDELFYDGEKVYVKDYHGNGPFVRVIKIPEMRQLSDVSYEELKERGVPLHSVYDSYKFQITREE